MMVHHIAEGPSENRIVTKQGSATPPPTEPAPDQIGLYAADLHRFVARRVANPTDAEDIAQQALLRACQNFNEFRGGNLRSWLFTISRHLIVDHFRTRGRFIFVEAEEVAQAGTEAALHSHPEAVQEVCANRERLRCYLECIAQHLRLEQQVAVLLADVHGYRDKEAAAVLAISVPSFKFLLHGARTRLQKCAKRSCPLVAQGRVACGEKVRAQIPFVRRDRVLPGPGQDTNQSRWLGMGGAGECAGRAGSGRTGQPRNWDHRPVARSAPADRVNGGVRSEVRVGQLCGAGCDSGLHCRLGLKCGRVAPRLRALRDKLLQPLRTCGAS